MKKQLFFVLIIYSTLVLELSAQSDPNRQSSTAFPFIGQWELTARDRVNYMGKFVIDEVKGEELIGFFEWRSNPSNALIGIEYFRGNFNSQDNTIAIKGFHVTNTRTLGLGNYKASLSRNGFDFESGTWTGGGGGTWEAKFITGTVDAQKNTEDDFDIRQNAQGGITIREYRGTTIRVVIPETIEGIKVTEIGSGAFYGKGLINVTIPNNVTAIRAGAFGSNYLTNIILPNSVTFLGRGAFAYNQLTSVTISNNITVIGDEGGQLIGTFEGNLLTSVNLPSGVKTIGYKAFNNNQLTSITIPNGVVEIGSYAFAKNQLTSIIIPASVRTLDYFSLIDNESLSNITINSSATRLVQPFFRQPLTTITLPSNCTDYSLQWFPNGLREFYQSQSKKAGTYIWSGRVWRVE